MKTRIITVLVIFFSLHSCKNETGVSDDISRIPLNLTVLRFDREFAEAKPGDIPKLKQKFGMTRRNLRFGIGDWGF